MSRPIILIVEDDDDLRHLYRTALTLAGFDVAEAASGLEALVRIDASPPDLIVLDLLLPKVSGFGVLYDLKAQAHTRRIPVLVVTGTSDEVTSEHVSAVLRKPISPDELVIAVHQCLNGAGTGPAGL